MSFKISPTLSLPRDSCRWVIAFLAKRGAGKTYCASDLAEEMMKAGIPIVVIDGMGIWWGLRVNADQKSDGFPIVVFGGEHADLPLVPDKAKQMARAIVESNISCVLDLSGFSKTVSRRIVADFCDELYAINRIERHVFIEEADLWAPQHAFGDEAVCLGAVDNFVRRGGNHNLGCTLITQRSAVLNKNILTQSDCLVILRTLAPQDKKAIQLWVEEMTDKDKKKLEKWYDSLKELDNGQAWVWHPEKPEIYEKVHFRKRETFHATREALLGKKMELPLMDVGDFVQKFKTVFEPKPKIVQPLLDSKPVLTKQAWGNEPKTLAPAIPPQGPIGQQPGVPVFASPKVERPEVRPSNPVVPTGIPDGGTVSVQQALPNLVIQQFKPDLGISVEMLDQPTTILGKVAVVLYNDPGNPNKWSIKRIVKDIQDHGWDAGDTNQAIQQLLQWEILTKDGYGGMLKVHRTRIKVIEQQPTLGVS